MLFLTSLLAQLIGITWGCPGRGSSISVSFWCLGCCQWTPIFFSTPFHVISTYSIYFYCTHLYLSSMMLNPLDFLLWTSSSRLLFHQLSFLFPLSLSELCSFNYSVKQDFILLTHYPYLYPYVYFYVCFYFISHCHLVSSCISRSQFIFQIYCSYSCLLAGHHPFLLRSPARCANYCSLCKPIY